MNSFETEWERPEFDSVPTLAENAVYLLPACDDLILRKTLQATYRDFCKRSAALRTWRKYELPREEVERGLARHDLLRMGVAVSPVLSSEIDCVTQVVWGGLHEPIQGWHVYGDPPMLSLPLLSRHNFFVGHHNVKMTQDKQNVGSLPTEGRPEVPLVRRDPFSIWVEAVEVPHLNEERAPKDFLRRYGDAIVDGALVRLFSMSNRPWSDAEQARQHGIAYTNALSEARQRSMYGGPAANSDSGFALDFSSMV